MIIYFTGTGNSRYCAGMLADRLQDELTDSFPFIRGGVGAELVSQRPWVFVSPTYAWQLPRIFTDFIRKSSFSGSREAYFVMTCGSDTGRAAAANRALCREKGLLCRGTLTVVMPENYVAMFPVPGEAEAQKIIAAAKPVLESGAAAIRDGLDFPGVKTGLADSFKSGLANRFFNRFAIKAKAFAASDACVGCGKCAESCPLGNITLQNERPVWDNRCTHCMACICGCPSEAIEYGKASAGKPRYQCPEYRG
ncbi:MAG: EFR1 family ferrodoxin [Bacillota bacterium]|nr:EFR1 family ferrodoxin [Bacillota bacterium]